MEKASTRLFWIKLHRWMGLTCLAFLFIAGVTGSLLCFDKAIDARLNRDLFFTPARSISVAPAVLAARFQAAHPELNVTQFPLALPRDRALDLRVQAAANAPPLPYDQVFLDPADSRLLGTRHTAPGWGRRQIVEGAFQLHQNLLAGTWGRWIMGIAALGWFLGNLIGLYLTFPAKKPFWPKWRKRWKIDGKAPLRRFMLELHNASGLWLLIAATIVAYTSVAMNFFDEAFVPMVEAASPARPSMFDSPAPTAPPKAPSFDFAQAVQLGTRAGRADGLTWQPALARFDARYHVYGISFTDDGVENYHRLGPVTYYFDATDGRLVERDDPYADSNGRKLVRSLYPLHSGDVAGPIGIAVVFVLGLAVAEMCVTGFYVWWKKRESRKGSRGRVRAVAS